MATFKPYVAFALLPGKTRRTTVLVAEHLSADIIRVYGPNGHLYSLPKNVVGRPRRSPSARVQAARLQVEYARIRALLRDFRPHSRGRRSGSVRA